VPAELNNIIRNKEDLLYRCTDDVELLAKKFEDADIQLEEYPQQISDMTAEKEQRDKELEEFRNAA
jgi:hypothetical protein